MLNNRVFKTTLITFMTGLLLISLFVSSRVGIAKDREFFLEINVGNFFSISSEKAGLLSQYKTLSLLNGVDVSVVKRSIVGINAMAGDEVKLAMTGGDYYICLSDDRCSLVILK